MSCKRCETIESSSHQLLHIKYFHSTLVLVETFCCRILLMQKDRRHYLGDTLSLGGNSGGSGDTVEQQLQQAIERERLIDEELEHLLST